MGSSVINSPMSPIRPLKKPPSFYIQVYWYNNYYFRYQNDNCITWKCLLVAEVILLKVPRCKLYIQPARNSKKNIYLIQYLYIFTANQQKTRMTTSISSEVQKLWMDIGKKITIDQCHTINIKLNKTFKPLKSCNL